MGNCANYDLNEIGSVSFTLNFDEDSYMEYLSENGVGDSQQARITFVKNNCDYDVECTDSDTYHHLCYDTMTIDEIEDMFGPNMAKDVLTDCMDGEEHTFEPLCYQNDEVDLTNPNELSKVAMKYLRYGNYSKDARGFILPNGLVVYTDAEHNMCSRIPGVKGTFHFIELGCIRVLPNSLDMAQMPTKEQFQTIYQVLRCYENSKIRIDLMNKNIGNIDMEYSYYYPQDVAQDISNYFKGKPIKRIKESKNMNNKKMLTEMTGAYEYYALLDYKSKNGDEKAMAEKESFAKAHQHDICMDLAETFYVTLRDEGYSQSYIYRISQRYIKECESNESDMCKEKIGTWFLEIINGDDDTDESIGSVNGVIDAKELGECLYLEMQKYCKKYRAKLDKNNTKRRAAKVGMNENKNKPLALNEDTLRNIVQNSFNSIIGQICQNL